MPDLIFVKLQIFFNNSLQHLGLRGFEVQRDHLRAFVCLGALIQRCFDCTLCLSRPVRPLFLDPDIVSLDLLYLLG